MQKLIVRILPLMTGRDYTYIEAMKGEVYRIKLTDKIGQFEKR